MATVSKPLRKASITGLPWAGSSSYFPASFCIPSPLLTAASTAALPSLPGSLQEFSHFREAERSTESFLHMFTQHTLSCHWGLSWKVHFPTDHPYERAWSLSTSLCFIFFTHPWLQLPLLYLSNVCLLIRAGSLHVFVVLYEDWCQTYSRNSVYSCWRDEWMTEGRKEWTGGEIDEWKGDWMNWTDK